MHDPNYISARNKTTGRYLHARISPSVHEWVRYSTGAEYDAETRRWLRNIVSDNLWTDDINEAVFIQERNFDMYTRYIDDLEKVEVELTAVPVGS